MNQPLQLMCVHFILICKLICQVQSVNEQQSNVGCVYGGSCAKAQDRQIKCPAGYFSSSAESNVSGQCLKCPVNFFNHVAGRESCLPCGSEAAQPEEGQTTCICLGEGKMFQPSDSRCPCGPGYQPTEDGIHCVKIVHDICRDGSSRNHEGKCLTKQEWDDYCISQVCPYPELYQGYEKYLGVCICKTEDLESICNADCRRKQKYILQIVCREDSPQFISIDSSGNQVPIQTDVMETEELVAFENTRKICSLHPKKRYSIYIVKTTEQGFWGLYFSDPRDLNNVLHSNISGIQGIYRMNRTSGVLNPTTCINVNDIIIFIASKHSFPKYDVNNLYNTNHGFDWGPFRVLAEEVWLSQRAQFSFLFQFEEPGVYVLKLSSNQNRKMFIRVMTVGGQCYEDGPFFPTAPRHIIRNGIAQIPPLLLKPDWPAIAGIITGLAVILITCVMLLVWFQDLGWTVKPVRVNHFRKLQLKYNLDSYSSKGSAILTTKKLHPRTRIKGHVDKKREEAGKHKCQKFSGDNEFWDYEQQVDMESFDTHAFYDILLKHSFQVTYKLGQVKDEVKGFFEKLVYEVSTLKETFVKRLSVTGHPKRYSLLMESYVQKKQEADMEITKRKRLAAEYVDILKRQLQVFQEDMKLQEEHCVGFNAALRESVRLLEMMKEKIGHSGPGDAQSATKWQKYLAQFDTSCNTMYTTVMKESNRLKLWGVLGEGTGAYLVNNDRTRLLSRKDLIASDGSLLESDSVCVDPELGLIIPTSQSVMLLSSHYLTPVPVDYFVHNDMGKALPIAGNVGYDPATFQLISTVDSANGDIRKTGIPVLPYIVYPLNSDTGLAVECKLPDLHKAQFQNFSLMVDPVSGLEVPILAVTRHPKTKEWLAVGGTYLHPLTNILTPIEIGGPMLGARGKIFPVMGVGIDSNTSNVIPLGSLVSSSGSVSVLGDIFCEPLSGRKVRTQGAVLQQDKVVPHAGGYQALLDSNLMMAQIAVIDALKAQRDVFSKNLPIEKEDLEQTDLHFTKVLEIMNKALSIRNQYVMSRIYNATSQLKMAEDIKRHGGNLEEHPSTPRPGGEQQCILQHNSAVAQETPSMGSLENAEALSPSPAPGNSTGMIKYHNTELWLPAVLGMEIPDPGPSDLMVPVLGVEHDYNKGHLIPIAGTMEDSNGRGLVPIKVGSRTVDPVTRSACTVVGAQINPMTGIIDPIMQPLQPLNESDSHLLEAALHEMSIREGFWQSQRTKEELILKDLNATTIHVLDVARNGKTHKIRVTDRIASLNESCQILEEDCLSEVHRRSSSSLNGLIIKISQLPLLEEKDEEKEKQLIFSLVIKKMTEKLVEFINRIEQESERHSSQLREWVKSRDKNCRDTVKAKQENAMVNYIDEFEDHIMKRLAGVNSAYCRLEYERDQNKLQWLLAKSYILGNLNHYINPQRPYWNATGKEYRYIGQMMVPMMKHLIEIMEETKISTPPTKGQKLVSGYSSRSTLKASAADSHKRKVSTSPGNKPKHSIHIPLLNNAEILQRHQDYLLRYLSEMQASELIHLERTLLTEEISRIWNFYESYKVVMHQWGLASEDNENQRQRSGTEMKIDLAWKALIEELSEAHKSSLKGLYEKHQEEVTSMGLSLETVIPRKLFTRDVKPALLHLAMEMQTAYKQCHCNNTQGVPSAEAKLFSENKDFQQAFLWSRAEKFVRQELLIQIYMYDILDAYIRIQVSNCSKEVQKIISKLYCISCHGKDTAREAANIMEKQYVEKLINFFKNAYKEKQSQVPLAELLVHLKEEHSTLTEKMLQDKFSLLLQEMAKHPESVCTMDYAVCFVLSQRHWRQRVMLLQDHFKSQDEAKLIKKCNLADNINAMHCQEDLLNLFKNKGKARFLLKDLQNLIKRIQLTENYLKELGSWLKEYCTDKVCVLARMEEVLCLESELKIFVEEQLKNLKEELKVLFESAQDSEQRKTTSEQREDFILNEKELYKDSQAKQAEVEQAHRNQITEEHLKLQDLLERGELSGFIKQKCIKEHNETIAFLEKVLQQNLDIKLESQKPMNKIHEETTRPDLDETQGKNYLQDIEPKILSLLADYRCIFQQAEQIASIRISLLGPRLDSSGPSADTNASKASSSLFILLKEVDGQLRAGAQNTNIIKINKRSDPKNMFRDIQGLQLNCAGNLNLVHLEDLSAREFVIYQYGIYILQLVNQYINIGDLKLCVASALPKSSYQGNFFAQCFYYQKSENALYVPREYLQSVGNLVLLLVHCTSHIGSGGFNDDSNPLFLRAFYQAIKICFSDGFFSTFELSSHTQSKNSNLANESILLQAQPHPKENRDFISKVLSLKRKTFIENASNKEPLRREEMLSVYETATMLKDHLSKRKKEFFTKNCKRTICKTNNEESGQDFKKVENIQKTLDEMNSQLSRILEQEVQLQKNLNNSEGTCYYIRAVSLEKEYLMKKIQILEEQITKKAEDSLSY